VRTNSARLATLLILAGACAAPAANDADASGANSLLQRASRVFDGRSAEEIGWARSIERLADADAVFLGETHLDRLTHEAEFEFLRALSAARGGQVALALEMFERDVQPVLDEYLAGRIPESDFLARSRPWPNYRTDYRPMIEFAKDNGIPVIASNLPADLRRKLAQGGADALAALTPAERALVPDTLIENPPEYWERVEQATLGHGALGMGGGTDRLYDGQNLWDNTMADSVARSLAADPARLVIHVNGGFHTAFWQGTAWQLQQRAPDARILTVGIETTSDLAAADPAGLAPENDFLVVVEARANSADGGERAGQVSRAHSWRLRLPPAPAAAVPLLIWLSDNGQTAEEALQLWQPALGDEAAILVLDPSFPFVGEDGIQAGRWFFPGHADTGGGLCLAAIQRAIEEAALPGLPVDESRIVLAGEGAGATMALFATRYARHATFPTLAFTPLARDEFGLMGRPWPLPEDRPARTVSIFDNEANQAGWSGLQAEDAALRLTTKLSPLAEDPADADAAQISAVRVALGLPAAAASSAADALLREAPAHPRAQLRARTLARRVRAAGLTEAPSLTITAAAFADGARLPRSSGSFGGTTIVVLPPETSAEEIAAWKALENPDVIQQRSRFHRLRIAHGEGESSPLAVIERLRAENAQRRDFLLVPAVFCADAAALRELRESLGALAAELRIEMLAGLGDRLPVGP
jgi:uncharacterized iron-regulated protein